jgi:hypothetical protein
MSKAKGRAQQEVRLAVIGPALPESDIRWSPDPERVEDWRVETPLLGLGRMVGRQGLDIDTGRLVEFSLSSQINERGTYGTDYHHHQDNGGQVMYFYDDRNTD